MTSTLPAGTTATNWDWDADHGTTYRIVRGPTRRIAEVAAVTPSAIQLRGGAIDGGVVDAPVIYAQVPASGLRMDEAQELAAALLAAVAEVGKWRDECDGLDVLRPGSWLFGLALDAGLLLH